jgi:hypothetical protein
MLHKLLTIVAFALLLTGCQVGLFFGGLPSNEACRDSESLPSQPISSDCLDTLSR